MNVTLEKSSPVNASLKVAVAEGDYKPELDKKLRDFAKKANIRGFRPGKVPLSLIQKMYGKSLLVDEINGLLSKAVNEYIRENRLPVVGDPMPDREQASAVDWDNQREFEFSYHLGLASDFEVDFSALPPVTSYEIQATPQDLETAIADLRKRFGGHAHVDSVGAGDMVYGQFEGEGWNEKSAIPTAKLTPDALAQFTGKTKGDAVTFDVQKLFADAKSLALATGKKEDEVADLQGEVTFTIEDITRNEDAEINQDLFDKVLGPGAVSSEEEFRQKVSEIIGDNYRREAELLLRDDLRLALLNAIPIDLPDEFLRRWLLETNDGQITEEEIEKDYDKFAEDLRWTLIRNRVAEDVGVKVEYAEVLDRTRDMVRAQFGLPAGSEDDSMKDVIDRVAVNYLNDKQRTDNFTNMFNRVYTDKVMDVIREKAPVVTQPIDAESFKAKAEQA
jgi:trigger factor